MPPEIPPNVPDAAAQSAQDYLLDMIEQLAEMAREIGEVEIAIHLDATVKAGRHHVAQRDGR